MLNKKQICIVLSENNLLATKKTFNKINDDSYIYELRADYLTNLSKKLICDIKKLFNSPVIFTLRSIAHGGKSNDETVQLNFIQQAIDIGFDYVDIEADFKFINRVDKKNAKFIISYHNFTLTPTYNYLKNLMNLAIENKADVIKIATQINRVEDLQVLAKLLIMNKSKQKIIVIGMGKKGKLSRIFFPILGSFLTYVPSSNKIVSGQLTLKEIQKYVS